MMALPEDSKSFTIGLTGAHRRRVNVSSGVVTGVACVKKAVSN